jgi:acyl-[acyl-carrier-protein]-phospholipid O-acyltransferase/long-chain-fatty-acid--[acyl-carrier-protein] ligase
LSRLFVHAARLNWTRLAMNDTMGRRLTFGRALCGTLLFREVIARETRGQQNIGLLLPTTVGSALANLAITMLGKTSVNLNYTASAESLASAIRQSGLQWILSSRAFLEKLGLDPPAGTVYIEDLMPRPGPAKKLKILLKAMLMPVRYLCRERTFNADDVATIIFSSGTTGTPKGVMLSHHNIISNIEGFRSLLRPTPAENICAALPFFHSFGFTCTLWLPLVSGFSVSYHPNPLDSARIAQMVRENKSTLLIATPTFLMAYLRRAKVEDFKTLRMVITGAEKLKKRVADSFEKRFGIRPLEGFGATELSPVVTVNLPDIKLGGVLQEAAKEGSVGQPIPGVAVKVVDPDSGAPVEANQAGLLLVKGPNVMLGYLEQPEKTAEVLQDGWYNTGDIAQVDHDGFVTITDRLSRFSKIGGEMIPHTAVEDVFYDGLETSERVLAVTSVPDEKKGEKLVVLYIEDKTDPEQLHAIMDSSDIPNLWKPGRQHYCAVSSLPILGSGKLDILKLRQQAMGFFEKE